METAENYVCFADSNAVASAEEVRAHTKPTSTNKPTSAARAGKPTRRRRVVHFENSDDEILGVRDPERIGIEERMTVEHGTTDEEASVSLSHLSHLTDASDTHDSPTITSSARPFRDRSLSPSLFIPEDRDPASVRHLSAYLTTPNYDLFNAPDMDGLNRARAIKAEISSTIYIPQPQDAKTSSHHAAEDDPETQLIKTLRQDQNMSWSDIAAFLNQERRNRSEAATFTPAAVYSRFVRTTPRIATAVGEIGFDTKDYMHLRHPNQYSGANGAGGTSKAGKKRVKNFDNAKELDANVRKHLDDEGDRELETPERTEQLVNAVAKVERNFWVLVADEMERMTTKMYKPEELAGRYHAI